MIRISLISMVLSAATLVILMASSVLAAGDGSTFHGDVARTGVYAGKAPQNTPVPRWKFETGSFVRSSVAVSDGTVYFGSDDGSFYAIGTVKGDLKWKYQAGVAIGSTAALYDGAAYFTDGAGSLHVVDLATGKLRWIRKSDRAFRREGWDYYSSSPAIVDGVVYYGSIDTNLYAVTADKGELVWSLKTKAKIKTSPAVAGGMVYIGGWDGTLYAANAKTGELKWKFKAGDALQGSPTVADGAVFVTSRDCNLYAFDAATGAQKWSYTFPGSWVLTTPAVAGGKVIVGSSDLQTVDAIDATTGKLVWSFNAHNNVISSPIVVGEHVIACGWDGYVHVLNLSDGKEVCWRGYVEGQIQSSPVFYDGSIYVGSDDHCMYRLK